MRAWHLLIIGLLLLIAGCSNGASTPPETPTARATSAVKSPPTFSFSQPTTPPQIATAAALRNANSTATVQAQSGDSDSDAVAQGKTHYEALDCASCHGENGEGTDKGSALIGYEASEADFISFLRSGGSVGEAHQYGASRLSDSEAASLYQYLRSLQE